MKLLVAEDDPKLLKSLIHILESNKFSVDGVNNGDDALSYAMTGEYDGLILDIMMPGMDGLKVLQSLRANHITTPALFLTARTEIADRVEGLDAGADDYLPKPFSTLELMARIRAMLRRSSVYVPDVLTVGSLSLDTSAYRMFTPSGAAPLNNKEFQVLELFMRSPHSVLSAQQLMERVWGWDARAEINVVWTNIASLRRKLTALKADVSIRLVRGVGYVLEST